jgi:hypothetical protein
MDTEQVEEIERLVEALGLASPAHAERLLALGLDAETAPAFAALALVEVAWADGEVDEEERWRVLEAATRLGVELGRPAHALLERWLERPPGEDWLRAWHEFAAAGASGGTQDVRRLLDAAEAVADSAGGVLGFHRVSRRERRVLGAIRKSLAGGAEGRVA